MAFDQFRGRMLSPETTAESTESSISQVHRWISDGKIRAAKLGYRMTRVDGDSLADFLTSRLSHRSLYCIRSAQSCAGPCRR